MEKGEFIMGGQLRPVYSLVTDSMMKNREVDRWKRIECDDGVTRGIATGGFKRLLERCFVAGKDIRDEGDC